jgi:hypothetical protein
MAEEILVTKARVGYSGIFSMDDFYRLMYDLFSGLGYDVEEAKYTTKKKPDGDVIAIEWNNFKKVDDYSQFKIWMKISISELEKVQVQIGGIPSTKNKGNVEMELKVMIITDYENRWEINPMLKFLKGIYDVYFYKSTFDTWKQKAATDMHTIENEAKAFFNMQRFM